MDTEQQIGLINACEECNKTLNSGNKNLSIYRKTNGRPGTTVEVVKLEELKWDDQAQRKFVGHISSNNGSLVLYEDTMVCPICGNHWAPQNKEVFENQIKELQELKNSPNAENMTVFIVKPVTTKRSGFIYELKQFLCACTPSALCCPVTTLCGPGIIAGQRAYRRDPNNSVFKAVCTGIVSQILAIVVFCGMLFAISIIVF